jgi:multidrug efflux pump subunit AcrA (membrane-fusion protein)
MVLPAMLSLGLCGQEKPPAPAPALVHVSKAYEGSIAPTSEFVGTTLPLRRTVVGSAVDGRVVQLAVEVGHEVKEGEAVAQLLTKTLEIELAAARSEYKLREAELLELKNGALPEEIAQAKSRLTAAEVRRDYLRKRLDRMTRLDVGNGIVSDDELQEVQSLLDAGEELVSEAKEGLQLLQRGTRPERIEAAEARLEQQKSLVELLEDRLAKYTVRAPFSGFVIRELTEAGYWLSQGSAVVEIIQIDEVEVEVYVPESYIRFVKVGEAATLKFDALPDVAEPIIGRIVSIVPEAETRSRTFPVRVRVKNPRGDNGYLVKPGMLAKCALPVGASKRATLIPKDALVLGQVGSQIKQIIDGKVRTVNVQLGISQGSNVEVVDGLKPGDVVAVFGNERLRDGETVRIGKVIDPENLQAVAQPPGNTPAVSDGG